MNEINWPRKLKYYYSKKTYPANCVEAANKMLAACQAAVEATGLEYELDEKKLYNWFITDGYSFYKSGWRVLAHELKLAEKELIIRTTP